MPELNIVRKAKLFRVQKGLSIRNVIMETDISGGHISAFENNQKGMGIAGLMTLAKLYGCLVEELMELVALNEKGAVVGGSVPVGSVSPDPVPTEVK